MENKIYEYEKDLVERLSSFFMCAEHGTNRKR